MFQPKYVAGDYSNKCNHAVSLHKSIQLVLTAL